MKNRILSIISISVALLALTSCEDILTRTPQDKLSPETFLKTETEMREYTNAFYPILPTGIFAEQSDAISSRAMSEELRGGRTVNSGDSYWTWTDLRRINTFLAYSGNCEDEALRKRYDALAHFFRAFFYFEKVKRFGDVPWYDHPLGSDDQELYKPRDSREYVMQRMLEDINDAIANLPAEHSDYRVTKWTALALKSRFCLYEGTFRKYHEGDITLRTLPQDAKPYTYYLEQAVDAADKFMASSGYSIYTEGDFNKNYIGLFTKYNVSEGTNKEVILARDYDVGYGVTHTTNSNYLSMTLSCYGITRKMIATYLNSDGTRFTDTPDWQKMEFVQEVAGRDPRLAQSIRTPGYCRLGTDIRTAPSLDYSVTGYCPIKYFMGPEDDTYMESYCDLILFRAAEVYLNYAEAKAELGTITQSDIDRSVKPLRDRVNMPNLSLSAANETPDPYLLSSETGYPGVAEKNSQNVGVILEIRRERAIELLGEGLRYDDIMRWAEGHALESPIWGPYFPGEGNYDLDGDSVADVTLYAGESAPEGSAPHAYKIGKTILLSEGTSGCVDFHQQTRTGWTWNDERDYYYPIPVKDRTLTEGAITQNPGWYDGYEK